MQDFSLLRDFFDLLDDFYGKQLWSKAPDALSAAGTPIFRRLSAAGAH
ncbi:4542_t:CDS:2, partial [Rhizophagus irregularis]